MRKVSKLFGVAVWVLLVQLILFIFVRVDLFLLIYICECIGVMLTFELLLFGLLLLKYCSYFYGGFKVAVNTIVPRSPFFLFLYLKTQTVTHIRKKAVEYLRQWNGAICVIYNLCQRQNIS